MWDGFASRHGGVGAGGEMAGRLTLLLLRASSLRSPTTASKAVPH
jgi:hypothetical protein